MNTKTHHFESGKFYGINTMSNRLDAGSEGGKMNDSPEKKNKVDVSMKKRNEAMKGLKNTYQGLKINEINPGKMKELVKQRQDALSKALINHDKAKVDIQRKAMDKISMIKKQLPDLIQNYVRASVSKTTTDKDAIDDTTDTLMEKKGKVYMREKAKAEKYIASLENKILAKRTSDIKTQEKNYKKLESQYKSAQKTYEKHVAAKSEYDSHMQNEKSIKVAKDRQEKRLAEKRTLEKTVNATINKTKNLESRHNETLNKLKKDLNSLQKALDKDQTSLSDKKQSITLMRNALDALIKTEQHDLTSRQSKKIALEQKAITALEKKISGQKSKLDTIQNKISLENTKYRMEKNQSFNS